MLLISGLPTVVPVDVLASQTRLARLAPGQLIQRLGKGAAYVFIGLTVTIVIATTITVTVRFKRRRHRKS